jgi:hypothetical protein
VKNRIIIVALFVKCLGNVVIGVIFRRRAQDIPVDIWEFRIKVEGESEGDKDMDKDDLPLQPVPSAQGIPGGSFFELPLQQSSPNRGLGSGLISEMFMGFDSGLSGLATTTYPQALSRLRRRLR